MKKKIVSRLSAAVIAAAVVVAPVSAPEAAASVMETKLTPPPPGTKLPHWDEAHFTQWAEEPVVRFGDTNTRGLQVLGHTEADTAVCAYSKPGRGACFINGKQAVDMGNEVYSFDDRVSAFAPLTRPVLTFYGAAKARLSSQRY